MLMTNISPSISMRKKKKQVVDYDRNVQLSLKQADPEVSPGMWEGDIAGLSPDVII